MEADETPAPRRRRGALFAAAAAVVALGVAVPTFALGAEEPTSGGTEVQQTTPREDRQRDKDCPFKDGEGQSEGSALSL